MSVVVKGDGSVPDLKQHSFDLREKVASGPEEKGPGSRSFSGAGMPALATAAAMATLALGCSEHATDNLPHSDTAYATHDLSDSLRVEFQGLLLQARQVAKADTERNPEALMLLPRVFAEINFGTDSIQYAAVLQQTAQMQRLQGVMWRSQGMPSEQVLANFAAARQNFEECFGIYGARFAEGVALDQHVALVELATWALVLDDQYYVLMIVYDDVVKQIPSVDHSDLVSEMAAEYKTNREGIRSAAKRNGISEDQISLEARRLKSAQQALVDNRF